MRTIKGFGVPVLIAGLGLVAISTQAATIISESSSNLYTVSSTDLLQANLGSVIKTINVQAGSAPSSSLTDGLFKAGTTETYLIQSGTVTFFLDTTTYPAGYTVADVNTYSGWVDMGRKDQSYTVSFRKVGALVFSDPVSVAYVGTNTQTCVKISDLNLSGVDALRFVFPGQQNGYVGYKEIDVIGAGIGQAVVNPLSVTGASSGSAYLVSNTDLLQSYPGAVFDALSLNDWPGYTNGTAIVLTNGLFGAANAANDYCAIAGGTVTYNLNTDDHPSGYDITTVNTYTGWKDSGRRDQAYTVSFRKAGGDQFGSAVPVYYAGSANQTFVKIEGLGLTGVDAVRFYFPGQQSGGVGYRELDVIGSVPAYADVTRLDAGNQVITNSAAANVRIVEGTGEPGAITLEAATNTIHALIQGATAGVATVDPNGGMLVTDGVFLQASAGGLTIEPGALMPASQLAQAFDNRSPHDLTVNAVVMDNRSVASDLIKSGTGVLKLNGTNTYSGVTVFQDGIVDVASLSNYGTPGALGLRLRERDGPRVIGLLFRGGTLRYSGSTAQSTDRAIRICAEKNAESPGPGGAVIDASGSVPSATLNFTAPTSPDFFEWNGNRYLALTGSNTGDNTFSMAVQEIQGATRVIKRGNGTWVLSGANIYSGGTAIEGGTLKSAAVGSGVVRVDSGAIWEAGVASLTIAGLEGSGTVSRCGLVTTGSNGAAMISTNNNYMLKLDFGNGAGATVNGVVFDNVGTSGTGWALTGAGNLYGQSGTPSSYDQLVNDFYYNGYPGELTFTELTVGRIYNIMLYTKINHWPNRPQNATFTNGTDSHQLFGTDPGSVGYYSYRFLASASTATVTMAPLTDGNSFHWFGASLAIEEPTALTVGDGSNRTFAGEITGATALVKQGSGVLTLSGANTYTGTTTVRAGALEITDGDVLPATTTIEINTGATMVLNNVDEQAVAGLSFDGVPQYRSTWGGAESAAQYKSAQFSGTGILRVLSGPAVPGTLIIIQ